MIESKSTTGTTLAVYSGEAVDALTPLDCATQRRAVLVDLTSGSTYRIRIVADTPGVPVVVRAERAPVPMVASVIDSDGDGSSSAVGSASSLAIVSGQPAVAYYDDDNFSLRFAERIGGAWSDVLVDSDGDGDSFDVGAQNSLAVLSNGEPGIAYQDGETGTLRFAERSSGVWSDVLVDPDGDGTSSNVGLWPSLIVLDNGNPAIAYHDRRNRELRYAERVGGVWSDVAVDTNGSTGLFPSLAQHPNGNAVVAYGANNELRYAERTNGVWANTVVYSSSTSTPRPSGLVFDSDGHQVIGAIEDNHQVVAIWDGANWQTERDTADRHHAELGNCVTPKLLIDPADNLYTVWSDCSNAYGAAVSVRSASGQWSVHDLVAAFEPPATEDGELDVQGTRHLGAAWLPDGRLAVTVQRSADSSLWLLEEAIQVDAGPDVAAGVGDVVALQGSGSDDWGEITSFLWSGAPATCSFGDAANAATSITCSDGAQGALTLTVTDTDGFTHTDTAALDFSAPEPEPEPDPDPVIAFCDGQLATIVGTDGPDVIVGTEGPDVINGLGGDDTITGLGGEDVICGGPGADEIDGGSGADKLFGNDGHDTIEGGTGSDTIVGGRSGDSLNGGPGRDLIRGGTGHDTIRGGEHADTIFGGRHGDLIYGGSGPDVVRGNRGRDVIFGNSGDDALSGGHAADILHGGMGTDACRGGTGLDSGQNCETLVSARRIG